MSKIHDRLTEVRSQSGLSASAFGKRLSLSSSAIFSMETGYRRITERTINDICREFGVNRTWLVDGTEPMYADPLGSLDLPEDVVELTNAYMKLSARDKILIKGLIDSLYEKVAEPSTQPSS